MTSTHVVASAERPRILYVDTADAACKLLRHVLARQDIDLVTCRSPIEAMKLIERDEFHVVVAGYRGEEPTPLELLRSAWRFQPQAYRVQVATNGQLEHAAKAIKVASLSRFIEKTWNVADLEAALVQLADEARAIMERRRLVERCEELETEVSDLRIRVEHLSNTQDDRAMDALIMALGFRESEARSHSYRSARYARILGRACGLDGNAVRAIWQGSLLHDLGKIGISDGILNKPGSLTDAEWDEMRWHPALGYGLLDGFKHLGEARAIVLQHHERWDGKGYPAGLNGGDIHVGARICAVADSVDAMTTTRPYRHALEFEEAWDEIARCSGSQFDPDVVEIFVGMGRDAWADIVAEAHEQSMDS